MAVLPNDGHEPRETASAFVKIRFKLQHDEEGWPPVGSEGLWGEPLGDDQYRVDNTPWFVLNLAADDIVVAHPDGNGVLWAGEKVVWSGRMVVRVIPWPHGPLMGDCRAVLDAFAPLGVSGEWIEQYGMVALDIPVNAEIDAVKRLLRAGQEDGRWDYEEGCVTEAWIAL